MAATTANWPKFALSEHPFHLPALRLSPLQERLRQGERVGEGEVALVVAYSNANSNCVWFINIFWLPRRTMGGRGHSPQIASLNQQEQPQQTTPSRRAVTGRLTESGQENWQTLEKHWENSQAENQIVQSRVKYPLWGSLSPGRIWATCLPNTCTHTVSLPLSLPPSQPPPLLLADYVMGRHLMIVLRRHEIDVFANFAIELQSKR